MDERRVQSLIINKDIDLFKNVKPFPEDSGFFSREYYLKLRPKMLDLVISIGQLPYLALSGKRIRKFIYKHMFTIMFIYLYILKTMCSY